MVGLYDGISDFIRRGIATWARVLTLWGSCPVTMQQEDSSPMVTTMLGFPAPNHKLNKSLYFINSPILGF